jgi:hypothetical protein
MLRSVGRHERAGDADYGSHCHTICRKSDIHTLNGFLRAFQKCLMHLAHSPQAGFAALIASAVWIYVVPVFSRVVGGTGETFIELL